MKRFYMDGDTRKAVSHPEWVRGLKLKVAEQFGSFSKSHPEWVRGLKLITEIIIIRTIRRTPSGCVD